MSFAGLVAPFEYSALVFSIFWGMIILGEFLNLFSIIGIFIVKLQSAKAPASALRSGTFMAPVIFVALAYFLISSFEGVEMSVWWCVISGAVGGVLIGLITEYYTGGSPVRKIAESGETGSATVMISGLSVGMQSVVVPIIILETPISINC